MKHRIFDKHFFTVLWVDLILLTGSLLVSYLVRFEFVMTGPEWLLFLKLSPFVLLIKVALFYYFDLYTGMWRYTSLADLFNIIKAASVSTLLIVFVILFSPIRFMGVSRSVFLVDWCFTILLISGFRMFIRLYFEHTGDDKSLLSSLKGLPGLFTKQRVVGCKNLVIIGAGDCGEIMYREIRDNAKLSYDVVGFLDDNPNKFDRKIHGVPVLGKIDEIKMVAKKLAIDEALIAIPSANSQQMRRIVDYCKDSAIDYKTIPGLGELINGRITVNTIREVAYRDLLGRDVVKLDVEKIGAYLENQCVLVTGAGGSIGSELCRQICRFRPQSILLYERAESPLYEIELELKQTFEKKNIKIIPLLADILDQGQLEETFEKFKPNVVFHAAAYKHVPMLEMQPWKAVDNNVIGTLKLVSVANRYHTARFVFVSTDKAVRSTNVMGATKRMSEMIVQSQNGCQDSQTHFMTVRFGNVVGSAGSVVPLFKKQIAKGGPLTVTHPDVTRYFMTIPEACQLILQAGAMGKGGEIFLLDMGTPIKIADMARDLIRFSGFEPEVDIKIEFIGMRPGEKLHEELITEGEGVLPTSHEKILVLQGIDCSPEKLNNQIEELKTTAQQREIHAIKLKLKEFIPDYQPQ